MRTLAASWILAASFVLGSVTATAGGPAASPEATSPPEVGETLPPIEVTAPDGEPFDVNAAVAEQPTILILYRGGW